jgi:protein-S-isoprenylcysteine O-methyltransferase Ste14
MWWFAVADNDPTQRRKATRRAPDPVALVAGILTLGVSGYVLTDGALGIPATDPQWLLAGAALLIGLLMLAGSLRSGRRHR